MSKEKVFLYGADQSYTTEIEVNDDNYPIIVVFCGRGFLKYNWALFDGMVRYDEQPSQSIRRLTHWPEEV